MRTEVPVDDREEAARERRQQLGRMAKDVQATGHLARQNRRREKQAKDERHRLEDRNAAIAALPVLGLIVSFLTLAAIPAVYLVDVSIFAATADYFGELAFPGVRWVALGMRLLIPLLVITLDVWIGLNLWRAAEAALRDPTTRAAYRRWVVAASLFVVLMPLFGAIAAIAAVMAAPDADASRLLLGEGVLAALLAFVGHAGILLGTRYVEKGLEYFSFTSAVKRLKAEEAEFGRAAAKNEDECVDLFENYWKALQDFNDDFDLSEKPWPFDHFTAALINERMGRKMVEEPGDATAVA